MKELHNDGEPCDINEEREKFEEICLNWDGKVNMTTREHKGYQGSVEVDLETGVLFGKILFVTDLVTYEAHSVPAIKKEFQVAVDDYLATCQQLGRNPQQSCSGVFNVCVGPTLHRAASIRALKKGVKLNAVMVSALEDYLA